MPARTSSFTAAPAFALPLLFLGYAGVANYEFATALGRDVEEIPRSVSAYLNGDAALQIDAYYRKVMPHRLPAIDLMGAARYLAFGEGRPGVVVGEDGWLFSKEEFEAPLLRPAELSEAIGGIAAIRDQLAKQGIELVLVPLPAKADIHREQLSDQAVPERLAALYDEFRKGLEAAAVMTVDARQALLAGRDTGQVFLRRDTHWTPLGAEVVAAAVGATLGGAARSGYLTTSAEPVQREGDLVRFIVGGSLADAVGLGPETVLPRQAQPVHTAGSGEAGTLDIFGTDAAIPAALVGTSYSANAQWSFAESLKVALGTDVLNVAEEGLGPVTPMRRYLASDALAQTPPQRVIWEFPIRYLGNRDLWAEASARGRGQ